MSNTIDSSKTKTWFTLTAHYDITQNNRPGPKISHRIFAVHNQNVLLSAVSNHHSPIIIQ